MPRDATEWEQIRSRLGAELQGPPLPSTRAVPCLAGLTGRPGGPRRFDFRANRDTIAASMTLRASPRALAAAGVVVAAGMLLASASAGTDVSRNVGWGGFGNTPDNLRHSPLTQITTSNVGQLGRLYTVDFRKIDASVRRGEQSYPVVSNGTMVAETCGSRPTDSAI